MQESSQAPQLRFVRESARSYATWRWDFERNISEMSPLEFAKYAANYAKERRRDRRQLDALKVETPDFPPEE
jgi:hypothetical protein